jgi:hypothetical protein
MTRSIQVAKGAAEKSRASTTQRATTSLTTKSRKPALRRTERNTEQDWLKKTNHGALIPGMTAGDSATSRRRWPLCCSPKQALALTSTLSRGVI